MEFVLFESTREVARRVWSGRRLVLGRKPDADLRSAEPTMSAAHAEFVPDGDGVRLKDLESLNGTYLNGVRVTESVLRPGDTIQVGRTRILVRDDEQNPAFQPVSEAPDSGSLEVSGQTLAIQLDQLRRRPDDDADEDHRIALLRDLFEALRGAREADEVLEQVRQVLSQAFPRSRAFLLLPSGEGGWTLPPTGPRRPSLTFATEAARSRSAILSSSLPDDDRFVASESARISGIETAIAAPVAQAGRPVAILYVDRLGLPPFGRRDLHLLGVAANHVSAVLESVHRFDELRRSNLELLEARESLATLNRDLERRVDERTEEVRRQSEEIAALAAAKDELLGMAAHDIRGPLTVIQGTAELLRLRVREIDPATLGRSLDLIHDSARTLTRLLSELLDARAIEEGKVRLSPKRTTVRELFEVATPVARLAAEDRQIDLEIDADLDLEIRVDVRRLGQALTNLLLNAVKFSETGTRIFLRARTTPEDRLELSVEDQGVGIPEHEIERIFGDFEQGEAGRAVGGSGLGLMIARRLVQLHGGELTVKSEPGEGSLFCASLPISGPPPSESPIAPSGSGPDS